MSWTAPIEKLKAAINDTAPILQAVADEVVLGETGLLARNYASSGLKQRSKLLYRGITQRGATGNYVRVTGDTVTVGVDPAKIKHVKWALEGRGVVRPRYKKALRFEIDGRVIFAKKVKASPPHQVYYLLGSDQAKAQDIAARKIAEATG
jgi:hypothetical protein